MEKSDRGTLLLSVPGKLVRVRIGLLALMVAGILVAFVDAWLDYHAGKHVSRIEIFEPVEMTVLGLGFAFIVPWSLMFYEKGVQFSRKGRRAGRFLPWTEVERYYWVGDMLYLSTARSVETWTIQPRNRAKMEAILGAHVPQPAVS